VPVSTPTRSGQSRSFGSPTARAKLEPKALVWQVISRGVALGYRRPADANDPGAWWVRWRDFDANRYVKQSFADADDLTPADGTDVLDHRQAVQRAHAIVQAAAEQAAASRTIVIQDGLSDLTTVAAACERYARTLERRGPRPAREARWRFGKWLGDFGASRLTNVTETSAHLFAEKTPARVIASVKAAFNRLPAAIRPPLAVIKAMNLQLTQTRRPYSEDTDSVGDVPDDAEVARRVAAARQVNPRFGVFAATIAGTGVRPSQLAMLQVRDLQRESSGYKLVVRPSEKGRYGSANKRLAHVPIGTALAEELVALAKVRPRDAFLFTLPKKARIRERDKMGWEIVGERPWGRNDWVRAAKEAGFEGKFYQFRHARICKLIMAGVPLRLIAEHLDTSTPMIERSYSRWISTLGNDALRLD
jgi:integrase